MAGYAAQSRHQQHHAQRLLQPQQRNGGVYTRWVEHLTITNSTFSNNGETAVSMLNTHNYWLAGNTATGNPNNSLPDNRGDCYARASL